MYFDLYVTLYCDSLLYKTYVMTVKLCGCLSCVREKHCSSDTKIYTVKFLRPISTERKRKLRYCDVRSGFKPGLYVTFFVTAAIVVAKVMFLHLSVSHSVHRSGVRGCSWGGHAWLLLGGMSGCSWGGMCSCSWGGVHGCCWGVCVVAPGGGHAWDMMRYRETINERAVRILLECILVWFFLHQFAHRFKMS